MATLTSLFANNDDLGPQAVEVLTAADLGDKIKAGMGIAVDDVEASEVVLVALLIDDSRSITTAGQPGAGQPGAGQPGIVSPGRTGKPACTDLTQVVRDGHNLFLDVLGGSKQKDGILVHCRYLNGTVLYPFTPVDQAVRMDRKNYRATGGTPLYDEAVALLGTVVAKAQDFANNGVACRTVTYLITDGEDCHSRHRSAADVAAVVRDMLRAEAHIVGALGIGDEADFRRIFDAMGIPERWVVTANADVHTIRTRFGMMSQSALRASQTAGSFSKVALGGFGGGSP